MEDLLDAIPWGFKGEEKAFLSLSLCQAVRGRTGGKYIFWRMAAVAAVALEHLLLGLAVCVELGEWGWEGCRRHLEGLLIPHS